MEVARQCSKVAAAFVVMVGACAPVLGVPRDPEDPNLLGRGAVLTRLEASFNPTEDDDYRMAGCPAVPASCESVPPATLDAARRAKRNDIVLRRLRALNIEFSNFEERLYGDSNVVGTGGDLLLLILGGLGATTGSAGTKAALSAVSTGIVGAQAAINRDLFYQRTIPALMTQMEANRAVVTTRILDGLGESDLAYPLIRAEIDLDALKRAGSIPSAITSITGQATDARASAVMIEAKADAAFVGTEPQRKSLSDTVTKLTDTQVVQLANKEIVTVASLPDSNNRQQVSMFLPASGTFNAVDVTAARQFLQVLFQAGRGDDTLLKTWSDDLNKMQGVDHAG